MNQREVLDRAQYLYDTMDEELEEDEDDFSEDDWDYDYDVFEDDY